MSQGADFFDYELVAAGQTDQILGVSGGKEGNLLQRLIVSVSNAGTCEVTIKDGAGAAIPVIENNTAIGTYTIDMQIVSRVGAWSVTTGAGATVIAVGRFDTP